MKIPFLPVLKWIGTTLLTAALQQGAERIVRARRVDNAELADAETDRLKNAEQGNSPS